MFFFYPSRNLDKVVELVGGGSVINEATPSSLSCTIEALSKITIQDNVLIGVNCSILDNDGHSLEIDNRISGTPKSSEIVIEKNVFIGDNVTILKGVTIGNNAVIASGSIVTKSFPENIIIGGVPAKEIGSVH